MRSADEETTRDIVAVAMVVGMLAHATRYKPRADSKHKDDWHAAIAEEGYQLADAMIKQSKEKP